jgi:predicted nucleic acid-binding protein
MNRCVIDAGILVKLFFNEPHSDACERLIKNVREIIAPDLIWVESAGVIRKRVRGEEIDAEDAPAILLDMLRVPIDAYSSYALIRPALHIAIETEQTVYDSLYVALAFQEDCKLLTADERLVNSLAKTPWAAHVQFVGATSPHTPAEKRRRR